MELNEFEKVLDLKFEIVNTKMDHLTDRFERAIKTTYWVAGTIVVPLVLSIFLFFLGKVI